MQVIEQRAKVAGEAFFTEAAEKVESTHWPLYLSPEQGAAHEAVHDRVAWDDADAHAVALSFDFERVASHLRFGSKPWTHMRVVVVESRGEGSPVDVFVLDGKDFDESSPLSWAAYMLCYEHHDRPLVAPPEWRGVAGSASFMAAAARAGWRVIRQRAIPWETLVAADQEVGFKLHRAVYTSPPRGDDSTVVPASRAAGNVRAGRAGRNIMGVNATLPESIKRYVDSEMERPQPRWVQEPSPGVVFGQEPSGEPDPAADARRWAHISFSEIQGLTLTAHAGFAANHLVSISEEELEYSEESVRNGDAAAVAAMAEYKARAALAADELVKVMGGVVGAIVAHRKVYFETNRRPMAADNLAQVEQLMYPGLHGYLTRMAEYGATADIEGEPKRSNVGPHKSALAKLNEMYIRAIEEFRMGVAIMFTDAVAEYAAGVEVCPMGAVDKASPLTKLVLAEARPIHNLKFGGDASLNNRTVDERVPPTVCAQQEEVAQHIVATHFRMPGVRQCMTKRDTHKAFRKVLTAPADCRYFSTLLPSISPRIKGMIQHVLCALAFGWKKSPGYYGLAGWGTTQVHRRLGPPVGDMLAAVMIALWAISFVDDAVLVEPCCGRRLLYASWAYWYAGRHVFSDGFLQVKKLAEEGMWAMGGMAWGRWCDLRGLRRFGLEAVTFELPVQKLVKIHSIMQAPSTQPGARKITMLEHQSFFGSMLYAAATAWALKVMVMGLSVMSTTNTPGWVDPVGDELEVALAWEEYDEIKTFVGLYVAEAMLDHRLVKRSVLSMLDPYDIVRLPDGRERVWVNTDANGFEEGANGVLTGFDHNAREAFVAWGADYTDFLQQHFRGAPKARIIYVLELLAVVAVVAQNASKLAGKIVFSAVDSDNARIGISKRRSKNRYVRYLLRILTRLELKWDFRLLPYYINTKANRAPDYLGREAIIAERGDGWKQRAQDIINEHEPGFTLRPLDKLLEFFTRGPSVMRTYALPDDSESSPAHQMVLQYGQWPTAAPAAASEALPGYFVEGCAGKGTLSEVTEGEGLPVGVLIEHAEHKARYLDAKFPNATVARELELDSERPGWQDAVEKLDGPVLMAGGGFPCQGFARPGLQLGMADPRSIVSTIGPVILMRITRALFGIFENVGTDLYLDTVDGIDAAMAEIGYVRGNKFVEPGNPLGVEMIHASRRGGPAVRARSCLAYEPKDAVELIGPCPELEDYVGPHKSIKEFLDPVELRAKRLIVPGIFHAIDVRDVEPWEPCVVGYLECGGDGTELFWGSVVEVSKLAGLGGVNKWRLYEEQSGNQWRVLPYDKSITVKGPRHVIREEDIVTHFRQRRPVIGVDHPTVCNTGFGEGPEGPGKTLILDTEMGIDVVRRLSGSELWRLGEDSQANLELYDSVNAEVTDADRARTAGDGIARRYAEAVIKRTVGRLRAYLAAKRRRDVTVAAISVQAAWRGRGGRAAGAAMRGLGRRAESEEPTTPAGESEERDDPSDGAAEVDVMAIYEELGLLAGGTGSDGNFHRHGSPVSPP